MSNARQDDVYDMHKDRVFQEPYTLYVGNLPSKTIQGDIDGIFQEIKSDIKSIRVIRDKHTDEFRGFCYVEFATEEALRHALTYDGAEFAGHVLKIDYADPKRKERSTSSRNSGGQAGGQQGGYRNNNNNRYNNSSRGGMAGRPDYQDNGRSYNNYNQGAGHRGGYMQQGGYHNDYQQAGGNRGYNNSYPQQGGGHNNYNQGGYNYRGPNAGNQQRGYNNRFPRQPNSNHTQLPPEPAPNSEGRPKLELKKRAVNAPTAALAPAEARSKIFGGALPREFNKPTTTEVEAKDKEEGNPSA